MPLDQAVVRADAGLVRAGTLRPEVLDVGVDIDAILLGELLPGLRQLEELLVQSGRRTRCREGEPVRTNEGGLGSRYLFENAVERGVRPRPIGIVRNQGFPIGRVPAEIVDIDAQDAAIRIDRVEHHDLRRPAQAVDQLDRTLPEPLHELLWLAEVREVSERQVAGALGARLRQPFEVRGHDADHLLAS